MIQREELLISVKAKQLENGILKKRGRCKKDIVRDLEIVTARAKYLESNKSYEALSEMVINYSNFNTSLFNYSILLKHYNKAWKWMNEARNIVMQKVDGVKTYFVSSSQFEKTAITTKDVDKYLEALLQSNWRSFDSMIRDINSLRSVVINSVSWKLSTCSCPDFYKNNLCKHIIGICAQLKIGDFEIPIESKFLPIGQKKKERST